LLMPRIAPRAPRIAACESGQGADSRASDPLWTTTSAPIFTKTQE
jgi:hypothetical protein